jgi:hypothetical protein
VKRRQTLLTVAGLALAGAAAAQQPTDYQPPAQDKGRAPTYQAQPPVTNRHDQNRVPVIQPPASAGNVGGLIQSFPQQPAGPVAGPQPQMFSPTPPPLSPYLNLARGFSRGGGLNAIDYYNFVRPITQPQGPYAPRGGAGMAFPYNPVPATVDPGVQLTPDAVLRSAGTPSAFMNTGGYFNRMGTIGLGGRPAGGGRAPARR